MSEGASPEPLSRGQLPDVLERIHSTLLEHRDEVDALNVFPVPDGDTGSNMVATARAAVAAMHDVPDRATAAERSQAVARGALRGARGNSGVILSQVIRALAQGLADHEELGVAEFAAVLERSRELAYDAVADPVEGTILTTITQAAIRARRCAQEGRDLATTLSWVLDDVESTTQDTLGMLAANRDAGVVDAGARGFALVIGALHAHVTGEPFQPSPLESAPVRSRDPVTAREAGSLEFRFEVQYLLDAGEDAATPLEKELTSLGDSVTVVAADGLLSVHVHTNDVGAAIEAGLDHGRPSDVTVASFEDQMAARSASTPSERVDLGCVAVLPHGRLGEIAREHAAVAVPGAAGDLPSVDELLEGIREAAADTVLLLPGHRNVVPTARQARDVAEEEGLGTVELIPATSAPAVVAALALFDPSADPDVVATEMEETAAAVRSGEVVAAVRDAETPIGPVRKGQYMAVVGGDALAVSDDPVEALRAVAEHYAEARCELVTLIVGDGVDTDERGVAVGVVTDVLGDLEVEVIDGRQRPARYLVGIE
ncbi:MAG: DAK2 domain-containing protein [Nitriliruptorales bacterium]|nr:DAK2 domain-containing protein [Nitriliruptorales bacterium]